MTNPQAKQWAIEIDNVAVWLVNGCDPQLAAAELRMMAHEMRASVEPATTPVATPGRCEGYAAVEMPDGFKVGATANTQIEAGTLLLEQLKTHYGRHFRLTDSNGTVICTTENRSDD